MILNLAAYRFVAIDDAAAIVGWLRAEAERFSLLGTVLVAPEGINLFLAGEQSGIAGFLDALRADARFRDLPAKLSRSEHVPFARLKVKLKREIIAFRQPDAAPLGERAPSVTPATLARWLDQGHDDAGRRVVLLDTRNREEFGHGTFRDAETLPIDNFVDFPAAVQERAPAWRDATVVPFCTGGIRCEKAVRWMQQRGIAHVQQLDGGILGYFEAVGGRHYDGDCFVFDARVALDAALRPLVDQDARNASTSSPT